MKRIFLPAMVVTSVAVTQFGLADYTGLGYEFGFNGDGTWTMQLFAEFSSATDQLNAVFGDTQNTLSITSTGGFYQNAFGGATSASINPALIPLFPSLAYDSWVTIGREDNVDNAMLDIGIDWSDFESGGDIVTDNGTWFATPDDAQVEAGDDLRVLIGQFTTYGWDSQISGVINVQGKVGDLETFVARDQHFGTLIPAPAVLALFGIAGFRKRRRT